MQRPTTISPQFQDYGTQSPLTFSGERLASRFPLIASSAKRPIMNTSSKMFLVYYISIRQVMQNYIWKSHERVEKQKENHYVRPPR